MKRCNDLEIRNRGREQYLLFFHRFSTIVKGLTLVVFGAKLCLILYKILILMLYIFSFFYVILFLKILF